MTLKDKKFIPYYIAALVIVFAAFFAVIIIAVQNGNDSSVEIITEPPQTEFLDGEVPYYSDIPASSFKKENFIMEDGRMKYTDDSVSYSTGIDVSSYQGDIDWEAVADDGIDFAIIRVGFRGYGISGTLNKDTLAIKNIEEALDAGIQVGVYFYSQAITTEEALEEAEFVLDIIDGYDIDAPVVFDWENDPEVGMRTDGLPGSVITDCAITFCEKVREHGYTPAVYFNLTDAYERYDLNDIKDYVFWYAQYEGEFPEFYYSYSIWQYSDSGKVDGIDGNVDLNIRFSVG